MTPVQHNEILQEFENLVAKIEKMADDNAKADYGTFFRDGEKEVEQLKAKVDDLTKENRYLQRQLEVQKLENRRIRERMSMKDKARREALERAAKDFSTQEKQPQMPHWTSNQVDKPKDRTNPKQRIYVITDPMEAWGTEDVVSNLLEIFGLPPVEKSKGDE